MSVKKPGAMAHYPALKLTLESYLRRGAFLLLLAGRFRRAVLFHVQGVFLRLRTHTKGQACDLRSDTLEATRQR